MANFKTAYDKTCEFEGGYSNDDADNGGETVFGIARNYHPKWEGWAIVDEYKKVITSTKELNALMEGNVQLQDLVESFYKSNYWDKVKGDDIAYQTVANNIYDMAVNSGVSRASKYAQRIVGVTDDGVIGNISVNAINQYSPVSFVEKFKKMREQFYYQIVENDESQEVFLHGWLNRLQKV